MDIVAEAERMGRSTWRYSTGRIRLWRVMAVSHSPRLHGYVSYVYDDVDVYDGGMRMDDEFAWRRNRLTVLN